MQKNDYSAANAEHKLKPGKVKSITSPRDMRHALGLSLSSMGRLVGYYLSHRSYTRSAIANWELKTESLRIGMTPRVRQAYRRILLDAVFPCGLQASLTGPCWKVRVLQKCRNCRRLFEPVSIRQRRCKRCQQKARR